jgi:serine/threonine protein kinase
MDNGREVTELSDVWSLAVVAAEILSGEIPFDTQQYRQLTVESFVDALANDIRPSLPPKLPDEIRRAVCMPPPPLL